jgi:hypothetical protein
MGTTGYPMAHETTATPTRRLIKVVASRTRGRRESVSVQKRFVTYMYLSRMAWQRFSFIHGEHIADRLHLHIGALHVRISG